MTKHIYKKELSPKSRSHVRLAVYYRGQENLLKDYTVNMSSGGVFIETRTMLPVDTISYMQFRLPDTEPDTDTIITCNARVAWTNEPGLLKKSSLPPGMGLQFLDLSLDDMYVIRDYLSKGNFVPIW
jgi:uncharacterized protein (TIGR02266 family)